MVNKSKQAAMTDPTDHTREYEREARDNELARNATTRINNLFADWNRGTTKPWSQLQDDVTNTIREAFAQRDQEHARRTGATVAETVSDRIELAKCRHALSALRQPAKDAEEACSVIAVALAEPAGGEYWSARKLADKWNIYNEDLEGSRVLLRLAEKAEAALRTVLEKLEKRS